MKTKVALIIGITALAMEKGAVTQASVRISTRPVKDARTQWADCQCALRQNQRRHPP